MAHFENDLFIVKYLHIKFGTFSNDQNRFGSNQNNTNVRNQVLVLNISYNLEINDKKKTNR